MGVSRRVYGYSKMDKEEPEERAHRRAQFLIYRTLEKADSRRKPSTSSVKVKLKIKIGNGLRSIKKRIFSEVGNFQVKTLQRLRIDRGQAMKFKTLSSLLFK
ncbi:hypothetical protein RJT34_12637 [Clitoria ternatea]|uniref:Uncharacterized protein n=1 Tax=Clitoria ternatea TaxID=43366 RepID=A0AAN9JMJ6_CLITE